MDAVEFLSVQEFARRAGVSTQAVYARFDALDSSYKKIEKRKKYISTAALELFCPTETSKKHSDGSDSPIDFPSTDTSILQVQLDNLKEQLAKAEKREEWLENQLAEKDKQIERLQDTNNKLAYSNQFLLSQNNKDSSPAGSMDTSKEESVQQQPAEQEAAAPAAEPQKRGFWARLFGL